MKKILLSALVAAAAAMPAFAGADNLNYQAVIKNGDYAVANKEVALKFELVNKAGNAVFTEEKSVTTNASGFVACQLGDQEDLTSIDWSDLTLKVYVDLGSGYEILSNEAVSSVPTAMYALRTADTDDLKAQIENLNMVASVVRVNEENIEDLQQSFNNLGENLTMSFGEMQAQIDEANGQLENLNMVAAVVRENEKGIEELNTNVDAFATMVETRLDKLQSQIEVGDQNFENLGENLDNSFAQMTAKFEEVDGQLENLNNVAAVVRANEAAIEELNTNTEAFATMVETRLDKMQNQMDEADRNFENLGENLDNSFAQMTAKFEEVDGQLENLNNVSAVVRANEEAIEAIEPEVVKLQQANEDTQSTLRGISAELARIDGLAEAIEAIEPEVVNLQQANEDTQSTLRGVSAELSRIDGLAEEIENIKDTLNQLIEALRDLEVLPTPMK